MGLGGNVTIRPFQIQALDIISSLGRALGIEIQGAETEPWSLLFHYTGNYFSHCVTDALSY